MGVSCALGFLDQNVRCCGLAQVWQLLRTKMLWGAGQAPERMAGAT